MNYQKPDPNDITDLQALRALAKERAEAGYKRKERLEEFILLGRFWADTCGNFAPTTFDLDGKPLAESIIRSLPKVLTKEELFRILPGLHVTTTFKRALPDEGAVCEHCGHGWTLDNCHDNVFKWDPSELDEAHGTFVHNLCDKIVLDARALKHLAAIAERSGWSLATLIPIPNGYMREGSPWVKMLTPWGNITFGWRRSVINIDWSDVVERRIATTRCHLNKDTWKARDACRAELNGKKLFDDNVTKSETIIHAWGEDKAVEYLSKLREVITKKPPITYSREETPTTYSVDYASLEMRIAKSLGLDSTTDLHEVTRKLYGARGV